MTKSDDIENYVKTERRISTNGNKYRVEFKLRSRNNWHAYGPPYFDSLEAAMKAMNIMNETDEVLGRRWNVVGEDND